MKLHKTTSTISQSDMTFFVKVFFGFQLFLFCAALPVRSQNLKLAAPFGSNMVIQQQTTSPIWGWDKEGAKVTIICSWDNQKYDTKADEHGRWKVSLNTPAAGGPFYMEVRGSEKIKLSNIFIGEVWLASGQSNMSMPLSGYYGQPVEGSTEAILNASGKNIHFLNIPARDEKSPKDTLTGKWQVASVETAGECSAVAWFFANILQQQLDVPIGIINASFGGSAVESWMPASAIEKFDELKQPYVSQRSWVTDRPSILYKGMIRPIEGYGIKGMIWYQGESNVFNVPKYSSYLKNMVHEWREKWACGEFPFYFTQIAPCDYSGWGIPNNVMNDIPAYLREAQLKSQYLIPNSAMAVTLDVGDLHEIHPPRKKEVGQRLALLALAKTYGIGGFEFESPEYESMKVDNGKVILHFSKQFMGITSFNKEMKLFEIAGKDRVFNKAKANVDGWNGVVVVYNDSVPEPVAVRYAFKDFVKGELFGTGGLPVSSFRTDNW